MSWKKELKKGMWSDFKSWLKKVFTPSMRSQLKQKFNPNKQVWVKAAKEMNEMLPDYFSVTEDENKLVDWEGMGNLIFDEIWDEVKDDLRAEFIKEWNDAPRQEAYHRNIASSGEDEF